MKIISIFFSPAAMESVPKRKASDSNELGVYLSNLRVIQVLVVFLVTDHLLPYPFQLLLSLRCQGCSKFVTSTLLLCPFFPATSSSWREHVPRIACIFEVSYLKVKLGSIFEIM